MIYKLYKYGYQHTAYWLNIEVSGLIKNINKNNNINFEPNEPYVHGKVQQKVQVEHTKTF